MSVLLETTLGDIAIDLFYEKCPLACKNFIKLCKIKSYNNGIFYDVQKDYITRLILPQPTSIYKELYGEQALYFDDEITPALKHNKMGMVCTANLGPNRNNSNFFITLSDENLQSLNGKHTIFGQVSEGLDVIQKINDTYIDDHNRPYTNIRILHTLILDDPFDDPESMKIPDSPLYVKSDDRLEYDDDLMQNPATKRTEEEIIEATKEHEAKTKAIVLEMINDLPDADVKTPDNVLFICKLNPCTTDEDLELIFSRFGPIRSCEVVKDWKTGDSLQYAFIEFETTTACEEAYFKMENALIDERRIHVDFSQSVAKMWPNKFKTKGQQQQNQFELKSTKMDSKGQYSMVFEDDDKKHSYQNHEKKRPIRDENKIYDVTKNKTNDDKQKDKRDEYNRDKLHQDRRRDDSRDNRYKQERREDESREKRYHQGRRRDESRDKRVNYDSGRDDSREKRHHQDRRRNDSRDKRHHQERRRDDSRDKRSNYDSRRDNNYDRRSDRRDESRFNDSNRYKDSNRLREKDQDRQKNSQKEIDKYRLDKKKENSPQKLQDRQRSRDISKKKDKSQSSSSSSSSSSSNSSSSSSSLSKSGSKY